MKFVLLTTTSAREDWSEEARQLYLEKLKHFVKFEHHALKPVKNARTESEKKKTEESAQIMKYLTTDDFVVLFDERGTSLDSLQFAKKVENIQTSGKKRAVFILGGAFGVDEGVRKRAQIQISLSKMVFNHLVAEVVILEQIYRAFAILKGLPYHNS